MEASQLFSDAGLSATDLITLVKAVQVFSHRLGRGSCWSVTENRASLFSGFSASKRDYLHYKALDARPLLLSLISQFAEPEKNVIVRRHTCSEKFCVNPSHYYFGTRADVMLEAELRKGKQLDPALVQSIKAASRTVSTTQLAKKLGLPYHRVQKIRSGTTYRGVQSVNHEAKIQKGWESFDLLLSNLSERYPEEVRRHQFDYYVANELECIWHRNGETSHKGRFGHMGECLDCLENIKEGQCTVDVTQFDYRWYWTVKRFWDQVDVKGEDECWPWIGSTKKDGSESVAYCPSPFHSNPSQSAMRVAYWLSRGYTGKYRIHTKSGCEKFCCNPKHLVARGIDDVPEPIKIETIQLNYVNIFEHFKKTNIQEG